MAGQQRRLAHASKRDSTAMKYISLLGALFLPATFLSSVFGMTFFNFQDNGASIVYVAANGTSPDPSTLANLSGGGSVVSPLLWIYFVVTIPITAIIVLSWYLWDRRREKNYAEEDDDLEKGIDEMESKIMASMRRRTMSKASTWNTISAGISSKFSE